MRRALRAVELALAAFLALTVAAPRAAAFDGFPVCVFGNDQVLPISVPDGAGGVIVIWHDSRPGSGTGMIFAQRLSPVGQPLWAMNGVQLSNVGDAGPPVAVADGAGGAFIAFGGVSAPPRAQRVNAAGSPQWGGNGVALTTDASSTRHLAITADIGGGGGAFVAWRKDNGVNGTADVFAQRLDAIGALQWSVSGVAIAATSMNSEGNPGVVSDGVGGAMFAWIGGAGVRAQRFNSGGVSLWNNVILAASGNNEPPSVVSDGASGAVIAWAGGGAFVQRVTADGNRQWSPPNGGVALSTTGRAPQLIADGAGGAIATWEDNRAGSNFNLYVQKVAAADGASQWDVNGTALCTATQDQRAPKIVTDGGGGAIIAWQDERNGPSGPDIFAQRINSGGVGQWLADGVSLCTFANNQIVPSIAIDGAGGAWVAWQDRRSGTNEDIFAMRANPNGEPLDVPSGRWAAGTARAWPAPFTDLVTMEFSLPATAGVRMRVFDLGGRMVADLGGAQLPEGPNRVTWNGRRGDGQLVGGGVYFISVEGAGVAVARRVVKLN